MADSMAFSNPMVLIPCSYEIDLKGSLCGQLPSSRHIMYFSAAQKPYGSSPKNEEIPFAEALGLQSAPQIGCRGLGLRMFFSP